jgi:hypothetical protein
MKQIYTLVYFNPFKLYYYTLGKLHVITELCTGGNLRHLLINSRVYPSGENSSNYINLSSTLNHRQLVKIAADISNGMVHLSSQKVSSTFVKFMPNEDYDKLEPIIKKN